jgi:hypothetical protein
MSDFARQAQFLFANPDFPIFKLQFSALPQTQQQKIQALKSEPA